MESDNYKQNLALHSKYRTVEGVKIKKVAQQIAEGHGARANS
jgi:hypothetical protein